MADGHWSEFIVLFTKYTKKLGGDIKKNVVKSLFGNGERTKNENDKNMFFSKNKINLLIQGNRNTYFHYPKLWRSL
jgi:hypothetical protein